MYYYYTPHNWAQAVQSFELNYDFMHMYYWKFDLFFEYITPQRHFLDLGRKQSAKERISCRKT